MTTTDHNWSFMGQDHSFSSVFPVLSGLANCSKLLTDFSIQGRSGPGDLHYLSPFFRCLNRFVSTRHIIHFEAKQWRPKGLHYVTKYVGHWVPRAPYRDVKNAGLDSGICSPLNDQSWRAPTIAVKRHFYLLIYWFIYTNINITFFWAEVDLGWIF